MTGRIVGIGLALLVHAAVILFGGIFFMRSPREEKKSLEVVDLVTQDDSSREKEKPKEEKPAGEPSQEASDAIQAPEQMPDLRELAKLDAVATAPALEAMSLGAMEDMLNPVGAAGGDFIAGATDLTSGGRIGGNGRAVQAELDEIFSIADLDQRPRALVQSAPTYPFELRRRKLEGSVSVLFVVDEVGRVMDPRVENASATEFEKLALDAVRQWKFEPAVRGGQKVKCKMRVPLRFTVS